MWGKFLTRLFALFGMSLTCVACYGTMYDEYRTYFSATGRVVDEAGNPIEGIKATMSGEHCLTDEDGRFFVEGYNHGMLHIRDIDGEENGGEYEDKDIDLGYQGQNDVGIVTLKLKDKEE